MKITVTAFLLTERDVKINHGLKKSQGKSKKNQGRMVNSEWSVVNLYKVFFTKVDESYYKIIPLLSETSLRS